MVLVLDSDSSIRSVAVVEPGASQRMGVATLGVALAACATQAILELTIALAVPTRFNKACAAGR